MQESMGRVHELNALKCNRVWTAMSEWRVTATGARGSVRCFFAARPSICASSCELWQRPTPGFCAQSPSLISSSSSLKKRRNGPN